MVPPAASTRWPASFVDSEPDESASAPLSSEADGDVEQFSYISRDYRRDSLLKRLLRLMRLPTKWGGVLEEHRYTRAPSTDDEHVRWRYPSWGRSRPRHSTFVGFVVRVLIALPIVILLIFGSLHAIEVIVGHSHALLDLDFPNPYLPEWGGRGHVGDGLAGYPTDATRDILPIPCHSHNDYWRRIPLFSALHWGFTSVEADVWLFDDDLFVGHSTGSLTANRTFSSLYINPLVDLLDKMNAPSNVDPNTGDLVESEESRLPHGVFDQDPSQTLVLLIDLKTASASTFPAVQAQLEPLRRGGYLSYWDGETFNSRAITVVGTGNTPFSEVIANTTYRDIFYDAPIISMWEPAPTEDEGKDGLSVKRSSGAVAATDEASDVIVDGKPYNYDPSNSFYASTSLSKAVGLVWGRGFSDHQLATIRGQIRGAKRRGLQARYWNTPAWPHSLRNEVWKVLVEEGVGVLNVDDLQGAAVGDWRRTVPHGWFS